MASGSRSSTESQTVSNTTTSVTDNSQQLGVDGSGNLLAGENSSVTITNNDVSADALNAAASVATNGFGLANATATRSAELTNMISARSENTVRRSIDANAELGQAGFSLSRDAITRVGEISTEGFKLSGDAIRSQREVAQDAIYSTGRIASDALARQVEAQADALSAVKYVSGRSADLSEAALVSANRSSELVARTLGEAYTDSSKLLGDVLRVNAETTATTREGNAALAKQFVETATTAISDSRRDTNEKILTDGFKYAAWAVGAIALGFVGYSIFKRAK